MRGIRGVDEQLGRLFPGDLCAVTHEPFGSNLGRGRSGRPKNIRLRIGYGLQALATARIGFAGDEKILESFRPAECIERIENFQQRLRPQFRRAMTEAVIPRDPYCEFEYEREGIDCGEMRYDLDTVLSATQVSEG